MIVREATVDDVPGIVAAGGRFIRGSVYQRMLGENPAQIGSFATWLINHPDGAAWVLEHDGAVRGILGATVFVHPMDGTLTAAEMCWWVDPEMRGHGLKLLRAFETWARDRGARKTVVVAPTPDVERLYERMHYAKVETSYERLIPCL
jgi:GNAT superfamily N-acetyltransferase